MKTHTTVKVGDISVHCFGDFTPEERMVRYFKDGSGHPGSPPEFEIDRIEFETSVEKEQEALEIVQEIDNYYNSIFEQTRKKIQDILVENKVYDLIPRDESIKLALAVERISTHWLFLEHLMDVSAYQIQDQRNADL